MNGLPYDFPVLKGRSNYTEWARRARAVFIENETWDVVSGVSKNPATEETPQTSSSQKDTESEATKSTAKPDWSVKNARAWTTFQFIIDPKIVGNFNSIENAHEIWLKTKALCGPKDDIASVRREVSALSHIKSSDFENVEYYGARFQHHINRLSNMGKTIPEWMVNAFYINGLNN